MELQIKLCLNILGAVVSLCVKSLTISEIDVKQADLRGETIEEEGNACKLVFPQPQVTFIFLANVYKLMDQNTFKQTNKQNPTACVCPGVKFLLQS